MEKYCDTNLNNYIKIKLTEEGRIIYKEHYAKYNCEAPKLNIDDEGYVRFQIHDFMNIFGERLFMGATLPCETNCKIQVKDEWHDLIADPNDLPKEEHKSPSECKNYYVVWFGKNNFSGAKFINGKFCDGDFIYYPDEIVAWKEIIPPKE